MTRRSAPPPASTPPPAASPVTSRDAARARQSPQARIAVAEFEASLARCRKLTEHAWRALLAVRVGQPPPPPPQPRAASAQTGKRPVADARGATFPDEASDDAPDDAPPGASD